MEANVVPFGESSIASVKITSLGQTVASIGLEKKWKLLHMNFEVKKSKRPDLYLFNIQLSSYNNNIKNLTTAIKHVLHKKFKI